MLDRGFGKPPQNIEARVETADFNALHLDALRSLATAGLGDGMLEY